MWTNVLHILTKKQFDPLHFINEMLKKNVWANLIIYYIIYKHMIFLLIFLRFTLNSNFFSREYETQLNTM